MSAVDAAGRDGVTSVAVYVHVADDGGLLVIDGETGRSAWVTEAELLRRVGLQRERGGPLLLSLEHGSPLAAPVVSSIKASGIPVTSASEIHPDAVRQGGLTALMSAAYLGATELVEDLLRRGADLAAQDEDGFTALMYAANGDQDEMVKLLIGAGADVNQADRDGSTALMFGAQHGRLTIVKRLLGAGADPNARRRADGLTARDFAAGRGHERVAAVLMAVERQTL
jgi:hypothetical protein